MRTYCSVRIHGTRWRYVRVPDDDPRLDGAEAMTVYAEATVYLRESLSADRLVSVVAHEDIHVALAELTVADKAGLFGCSEDDVTDAEERLASTLGPLLAQVHASRRKVRA